MPRSPFDLSRISLDDLQRELRDASGVVSLRGEARSSARRYVWYAGNNLTLAGPATIRAGLDLYAPGLTLKGLTLAASQHNQTICRVLADGQTLHQCRIQGPSGDCGDTNNALLSLGDSRTDVKRTKVVLCTLDGANSSHKGIYIHSAGQSLISENTIRNVAGNSIQVNPRRGLTLLRLRIAGNDIGPGGPCRDFLHNAILVDDVTPPVAYDYVTIEDNYIHSIAPGSEYGIKIRAGDLGGRGRYDGLIIRGNTFRNIPSGVGINNYGGLSGEILVDHNDLGGYGMETNRSWRQQGNT